MSAISSTEAIDVRLQVSDQQLALHVSDERASLLALLRRTEDLAGSPDGSLLVVAGFASNELSLIRYRIDSDGVEICDVRAAAVDGLRRPHGLAFLDDVTMLVANRESELSVVRLDDRRTAVRSAAVLIDGSADVPVRTPGSVAVRQLGGDLAEVFVCNNYAHDVTRYVLDGRHDWSIVDGERLLAADLEIPDGVAVSANGKWIAISNHDHHAVYLYRYDGELSVDSPPTGILRGVNYPHGLAFADRDRQLLVADAGLPNLYSFDAPEADWSGERVPWRIDRVMDEQTFHRGRCNPQEGGPKGIEVVGERIVALTSEFQPLAFFALHERGAPGEQPARGAVAASDGEELRVPVLRLAGRLRATIREVDRTTTDRDQVALARDHVALERDRVALERDQVARERDHLAMERDHLVAELAACISECDEIRLARSTAQQEADHLHGELERVCGHHADASVEIDRLVERTDELEAHIAAMYASRSWRWSSPLRGGSWLIRRARSVGRPMAR